jgi:hypothetical protein
MYRPVVKLKLTDVSEGRTADDGKLVNFNFTIRSCNQEDSKLPKKNHVFVPCPKHMILPSAIHHRQEHLELINNNTTH